MGRPIGWAALLAGAVAASACGLPGELAFAASTVGGLGLAHGASDLAIVPPSRRPVFLACYLVVLAGVLAWWVARPHIALPAFLALSAIHFALEDAGPGDALARWVHGLLPIAAPAVLHRGEFARILALAGGDPAAADPVAAALCIVGSAALVAAAVVAWRARDLRLIAGAVVLFAFPPLVGFALGFLILHALPQTGERARRLGHPSLSAYHRQVLPMTVAALGIAGAGAALVLRYDPTGVRLLFAALAALAVPHMLVTPLFETVAIPRGDRWDRSTMPATR